MERIWCIYEQIGMKNKKTICSKIIILNLLNILFNIQIYIYKLISYDKYKLNLNLFKIQWCV